MRTKAVRLCGAPDLRLEEFELYPIRDDEILVKVVLDNICIYIWVRRKRIPDAIRVSNLAKEKMVRKIDLTGSMSMSKKLTPQSVLDWGASAFRQF